jgi:hypothetical protein
MGQAVNDTRRLVYGSMNEQINLLDQDYPVDGDRLVMKLDVSGITPGMIVSHGLNVWYVTEVTPAAKTVYVVPRYDGSFSERLSAGAVIMIRPRVTDWVLFNEVNRCIVQMSSRTSGLYRLGHEFISSGFNQWGRYVMAAPNVQSIIAIRAVRSWGDPLSEPIPDRMWRWDKHTGAIRIFDPEFSWASQIDVTYRAPFLEATSLEADLVSQCGLAPSMEDIPSLGAASALLLTTEGRRNQVSVQGDPRRPGEVPPGSNSSAAREMRRRYEDRIDDEYARLINADPIMRTI